MRTTILGTALGVLVCLTPSESSAQTRTPWQQHDGYEVTNDNPLGLIDFFRCDEPEQATHGAACEYDVADIPEEQDEGWVAAPDGDAIDFSVPSRVCSAPITCYVYGDFTYFQTLVDVPADVAVTKFTITFIRVDDGARVSIFNSAHPDGFVLPDSYVHLGGSGVTDLTSSVVSGEVNRVVITQVDDCCYDNFLGDVEVVLEGEEAGIVHGVTPVAGWSAGRAAG